MIATTGHHHHGRAINSLLLSLFERAYRGMQEMNLREGIIYLPEIEGRNE